MRPGPIVLLSATCLLLAFQASAAPALKPAAAKPAAAKVPAAPLVPAVSPAPPDAPLPLTTASDVMDGLIGSDHIVWLTTKTGLRRLGTFQGVNNGRYVFQHLHFIKGIYHPLGMFRDAQTVYYRDGDAVGVLLRPRYFGPEPTYDSVADTEKIDPAAVVTVEVIAPPAVKMRPLRVVNEQLQGPLFVVNPWVLTCLWPPSVKAPAKVLGSESAKVLDGQHP